MLSSLEPILGTGYKTKAFDLFKPEMVLGYSGYFLLGHYLSIENFTINKRKTIYLCGILTILVASLGTIVGSNLLEQHYDFFFGYYNITTFIASIAVFVLFKYELKNIQLSKKQRNIIKDFSECTMGVYILHNLFLWGLIDIGFSMNFTTTVITIPLLSLIVFTLSIGTTFFIRRFPFVGKYIV